MPSKHARLSPSAADRWIHCPASIHLAEQAGVGSTSSPYADEGTAAHAIAEWKLHKLVLKDTRRKMPKSEFFDEEMDRATDFYAARVRDIYQRQAGPAELMVEQEFSLEPYIPEGFGTSDAVVISDQTLHVIDLKYGKGVRVEAKNNPQLRSYALGTLSLFDGLIDCQTVVTHIIQPRLDHISEETISAADLLSWGTNVLQVAAQKAWNNSDETAAGNWCRFCPVSSQCRVRAESALQEARNDFKEPALLSDEELGAALASAVQLKAWIDDVQAYVTEKALEGRKFSGWKLVEGRSVRKYSDDLAVEKRLEEAGYERAVITETKLLGITAMEKAVGKKALAEICGDLIIKPQGKPTLVPETDKRPEYRNAIEEAKADFKEDF